MERLGWVRAPEIFRNRIAELHAFADEARRDGIRDVVLCGMGGSSLAPEVLAAVFPPRVSFPRLTVLDSTSPDAILDVERSVDLAHTLFLVSSKSGTTIETECLRQHFSARLAGAVEDPARHLVAITDPGSSLAQIAEKDGWRALFENPADIGGRYSALSFFGLVPAALLGLDLERLLDSAQREALACRPGPQPSEALLLGAAMGTLARQGTDKFTLRCSPGIAAFGGWAEQLVAESTGKMGTGVVPICNEPSGAPGAGASATRDRFVVDVVLGEDASHPPAPADAPNGTMHIRHPYELGALFYRFEMATAIACSVLGVNAFDQPNVAEAKDATAAVLGGAAGIDETTLATSPTFRVSCPTELKQALGSVSSADDPAAWLRALLRSSRDGDYVALLAYVARNEARTAALQQLRGAAGSLAGRATTLGYGPCYLHSTGQLHKGGGAGGIFLLVEAPAPREDLPIPGRTFTFGQLFHAQAEGDFRTLARRGRRVLRVRLADPLDTSLAALRDALRAS